MSVLVNFALFPTDQGTSVSKEVSKIIKCVADSGFEYKLNAMGTVFETKTMEQALALIQSCYTILEDHKRIYLVMSMDIQKDKGNRIVSKINSIEEKIGLVNT